MNKKIVRKSYRFVRMISIIKKVARVMNSARSYQKIIDTLRITF